MSDSVAPKAPLPDERLRGALYGIENNYLDEGTREAFVKSYLDQAHAALDAIIDELLQNHRDLYGDEFERDDPDYMSAPELRAELHSPESLAERFLWWLSNKAEMKAYRMREARRAA